MLIFKAGKSSEHYLSLAEYIFSDNYQFMYLQN